VHFDEEFHLRGKKLENGILAIEVIETHEFSPLPR
jgi:hypothetical protein